VGIKGASESACHVSTLSLLKAWFRDGDHGRDAGKRAAAGGMVCIARISRLRGREVPFGDAHSSRAGRLRLLRQFDVTGKPWSTIANAGVGLERGAVYD
jgi:hypothetical protein